MQIAVFEECTFQIDYILKMSYHQSLNYIYQYRRNKRIKIKMAKKRKKKKFWRINTF